MSDNAEQSGRRRRFQSFILVPVLAVIALTAWGFASPVGASPDDDFHLASIWCAVGEKVDACEEVDDPASRIVPRDLLVDSVCYAMKSTESAVCQGSDYGGNPDDVVGTQRGNFEGLYPPVFYTVTSVFVGSNVEISVLAIRILNALIFVGMMTALWFLLPSRLKPTLVWATVITAVPFGMFLIPSVNPSSWAILSAGTLWISLLGFFESSGKRKIALGAMAVLATVIGAGARADAAVYSVIAVGVVVILAAEATKRFFLSLILPVVLGLIAVGFYLSAGQSQATSTGLGAYGQGPMDLTQLFIDNILNVPSLWVGAFGGWSLGWMDTGMPDVVWVSGFAIFCGLLFAGLGVRYRRKGLMAAALVAAMFVIPTVLLVQSKAIVGEAVQPRYILPLLIILAGVCLLQGPTSRLTLTRTQLIAIVGALSFAQSLALHVNLRRYITGVDVNGWNLDAGIEWWWNVPFSPMTVWIVGTLTFTAMLILIAMKTYSSTSPALTASSEPAPTPEPARTDV
ncbi:MAG TPA: DUF2142 domain-containing protein [Glaciihabitans sp.]|jgi:hypothetical protein|nr:DUF2142 domain-containing protein [Glaciihabitans sp.]